MKLLSPVRIGLVASIVLIGLLSAGLAQTTPETPSITIPAITAGLPYEDVRPGSMASRSPGLMVLAGVARAQTAVKMPYSASSATITATDEPGPLDLFLTGAVEMLLQQLEDLLIYFSNLFLERIGLPPIDSNTNDNDNSNANDNTNGNTNENDNTNSNANDNTNGNTNENDNANTNDNGNDNTSSTTGRPQQTGVRKRSLVPQQ